MYKNLTMNNRFVFTMRVEKLQIFNRRYQKHG